MTYLTVQRLYRGEWMNWFSPFESRKVANQCMADLIRENPLNQYLVVPWEVTRQLATQ